MGISLPVLLNKLGIAILFLSPIHAYKRVGNFCSLIFTIYFKDIILSLDSHRITRFLSYQMLRTERNERSE